MPKNKQRQILDEWDKYRRFWNPKSLEERQMLSSFLQVCLTKMSANEMDSLDSEKVQQVFKQLFEGKIDIQSLIKMPAEDFLLLLNPKEKS